MASEGSAGRRLGLVLATGVLAVACGAPSAPPSEAAASTAAAASEVALPSPTSAPQTPQPTIVSPTPAASAMVTVGLGEVGVTPLRSRVTVHAFGPGDRSKAPPAGAEWLEADLEWCLAEDANREVTVGNIRYEVGLELTDGTTIRPEPDADSPDEVYASEGTFGAGECVRGALVFEVPTDAEPAYLVLVRRPGVLRWRLS